MCIPSRPEQSLVNHVWPVGCTHDKHTIPTLNTVKFREKLGYESEIIFLLQIALQIACNDAHLFAPEPLSLPDLLGAMASNSSKKMMHGLQSRARWNTCRTARSLSPTY